MPLSAAGKNILGDNLKAAIQMTGDLHCHTTYSDGSEAPSALPGLALRFGIGCVAITDHDGVGGWDEASLAAKGRVRLIRGIEISTLNKKSGRKVHLLCYEPEKNAALMKLCETTQQEREKTSEKIIDMVAEKYPIDKEYVLPFKGKGPVIFKQHIAAALMHMGYSVSVFGPLYDSLFSKKSGWARLEPPYPETVDALRVLKSTGGVCVLAHPGVSALKSFRRWPPKGSTASKSGIPASPRRIPKRLLTPPGGSGF